MTVAQENLMQSECLMRTTLSQVTHPCRGPALSRKNALISSIECSYKSYKLLRRSCEITYYDFTDFSSAGCVNFYKIISLIVHWQNGTADFTKFANFLFYFTKLNVFKQFFLIITVLVKYLERVNHTSCSS